MMNSGLLHPQILCALAGAGHNSRVLIADANYPASTTRGPRAEIVQLNLVPGTVDAVTVLRALVAAVPVEEAAVMQPDGDGAYAQREDPPIWQHYTDVLAAAGFSDPLRPLARHDFYAAGAGDDVALVVVSGETAFYANVLLRIGAVAPA